MKVKRSLDLRRSLLCGTFQRSLFLALACWGAAPLTSGLPCGVRTFLTRLRQTSSGLYAFAGHWPAKMNGPGEAWAWRGPLLLGSEQL